MKKFLVNVLESILDTVKGLKYKYACDFPGCGFVATSNYYEAIDRVRTAHEPYHSKGV